MSFQEDRNQTDETGRWKIIEQYFHELDEIVSNSRISCTENNHNDKNTSVDLFLRYDERLLTIDGLWDALCHDYLAEKQTARSCVIQVQAKDGIAYFEEFANAWMQLGMVLASFPFLESLTLEEFDRAGSNIHDHYRRRHIAIPMDNDEQHHVSFECRVILLWYLQQVRVLHDLISIHNVERYAWALQARRHASLETLTLRSDTLHCDQQSILQKALLSLPQIKHINCSSFPMALPSNFPEPAVRIAV